MHLASGGRFVELGAPTGGEALAALEESMAVIRAMWSDAPSAGFRDEYYRLRGVRLGPVCQYEIGIWVGSIELCALSLTGCLAHA